MRYCLSDRGAGVEGLNGGFYVGRRLLIRLSSDRSYELAGDVGLTFDMVFHRIAVLLVNSI